MRAGRTTLSTCLERLVSSELSRTTRQVSSWLADDTGESVMTPQGLIYEHGSLCEPTDVVGPYDACLISFRCREEIHGRLVAQRTKVENQPIREVCWPPG